MRLSVDAARRNLQLGTTDEVQFKWRISTHRIGKPMLKRMTITCFAFMAIASSGVVAQEVTTTEQALSVAVGLDKVPDPETLRIESMKVRFSSRGNNWQVKLRGGEITYKINVSEDGKTSLDRDIDEGQDVPAFWAAQPALAEHETPEYYLEKASEVLSGLNDTYRPTGRAIVEFEVCDPPAPGVESKYTNGCKNERALTKWVVFTQVAANVRGKDDKFFKAVKFLDGRVTEVSDAMVSGIW
ncbi:hypothetical protein [Halovulum sp. GXIMD14793]